MMISEISKFVIPAISQSFLSPKFLNSQQFCGFLRDETIQITNFDNTYLYRSSPTFTTLLAAVVTLLKSRTTNAQWSLFSMISPKFLGLDRQIGLINFGTFEVFLAKLSALFWHCEFLVHGKTDLVGFPTKNFGLQA